MLHCFDSVLESNEDLAKEYDNFGRLADYTYRDLAIRGFGGHKFISFLYDYVSKYLHLFPFLA